MQVFALMCDLYRIHCKRVCVCLVQALLLHVWAPPPSHDYNTGMARWYRGRRFPHARGQISLWRLVGRRRNNIYPHAGPPVHAGRADDQAMRRPPLHPSSGTSAMLCGRCGRCLPLGALGPKIRGCARGLAARVAPGGLD
jgi:hypothetical protein